MHEHTKTSLRKFLAFDPCSQKERNFSTPESPHHEIQLFSIVVVYIMVNLQLQLTDTTWRQNRIVPWSSEFFPLLSLTNIRELRKLSCKPSLGNSYQLSSSFRPALDSTSWHYINAKLVLFLQDLLTMNEELKKARKAFDAESYGEIS
jgi:hypothetical protein